MATELLSFGRALTILQNVVYALPSIKAKLYTNTAAATLQQSNDITFATFTAVTLVEGQYDLAAAFLRCTSGNALIELVRD